MRRFITVIITAVVFLLAACTNQEIPERVEITNQANEDILSALTVEQKIGQLFCVSFSGTKLDNNVRRFLEEYSIGNVILFSKNIDNAEQTADLCRSIQLEITANTKVPAFIGTDQEGGQIVRVTDGAVYYPAAMAIAAAGNADNVKTVGEYMGAELRALGINIDFAPDADVNSNPDNPVIGTRSFGDNAENVAEYASAFVNGMNISSEVSTAKHYPGHGDTDTDSHYGLPMVDKPLDALMENELIPFKRLIENGVPVIMAAHILYPQIDADYPASMSKIMLTEVLRSQLGFNGVIVTDGLRMGAVTENFGADNACVAAINAGADLLLTGSGGEYEDLSLEPQIECVEKVREAVYSGEISEETLNAAVERILKCKQEYNIGDCAFAPLDSTILAEHQSFSESISRDSITVVCDENNLIPLNNGEDVLIIASGEVIKNAFEAKTDADIEVISANDIDALAEKYSEMAAWYDKVIICADRSSHAEIINAAAAANPNTIAVLFGSPYMLRGISDCSTVLCAYECTASAAEAAAAVLTGEAAPIGILPVG